MNSPLPIAGLLTLTGLALGGFTSNAFIVVVIAFEWAKSKNRNASELLLLSLGMSNLCCTASMCTFLFDSYCHPIFKNIRMSQAFVSFWNTSMLSRFWFIAWLCVFYCIKIVNNTHCLFLWCRQRISCLLPWILVTTTTVSFLSSVFSIENLQNNATIPNITVMDQSLSVKEYPSFTIFFFVIGSSCPLLVVLFCSIVTVASLCKHVCQMRDKESSFRSYQTEAHFKAAGTLLFLLFLYLSYYIILILLTKLEIHENKIGKLMGFIVIMGFSLAQAVILMWVNPMLKQAIPKMLPCRKL